jgi:hypothetical protein
MGLSDIKEKRIKEYGHMYRERKENGFRVISPSGAKNFLSKPYEWRLNVLDNTPTFFGNEATVVGSLVHRYIELYRSNELTQDGRLPTIDRDTILATTSDYNVQQIHNDYPMMCEAVKEHYLDVYPTDVLSEEYMELELTDRKILIAGTVDELDLNNGVLTDFKTCSKAPKDESFMLPYLYQLSVYNALLMKTRGVDVDRFRIVFIQRPTKTIGSRIYIAECDAISNLGSDLLNNILETIDVIDSNPKMKDIIFREDPLSGFVNADKKKQEEFINKYVKNFKLITQEDSKIKKIQDSIFG